MVRPILLLLSITFGMSVCLPAQSNNHTLIDSLEHIIQSSGGEPTLYYELAQLYSQIDSNLALKNAFLGLEIAKQHQDNYHTAKGYFTIGNLYLDYNESIISEHNYHQADSILNKLIKKDSSYQNLRLWVRNNFNTNVALSYRGINKDIEFLEKITPIAEQIQAYDILAKANSNLAINFFNTGQHKKAYDYFLKSGPQHEKLGDYTTLVEDRLVFSSCLIELDSLEKANSVLDEVKAVIDSLQDPVRLQIYHTIRGKYYSEKEAFDLAIEHFQKAEALLMKNEHVRNNLQLYMDFMQAYGQAGDYDNALKYATISLHLTQKNKNKVLEAEIYKLSSIYESNINHYRRAFESLHNYVKITDSLNIKELEQEVNRLEAHYQSERKEIQILELQNENSQVELLLARKRSQNYLLILASFGFLGLAGFAFLGYRIFRKRDQLKAKEIERLKYEQDAIMSNAMLEGQENERKRIAIDLHDGLAGRLSATRIKLEKLSRDNDRNTKGKAFQEAALSLDESLSELRSIAQNLMPETLFRYGLKNAIEDYCSSLSRGNSEIKFILQFYDTEIKLTQNTLLTIYRIIQELINNAVKHAKANELLVQVSFENEKADITVEDNGIGFMKQNLETSSGMGLKNLQTRVAYLNGEIDFESTPGEGTTVHIVIDTNA